MELSQRKRRTQSTWIGHLDWINDACCIASYTPVTLLVVVFSMILLLVSTPTTTVALTRPMAVVRLTTSPHRRATFTKVITAFKARARLNQATAVPWLHRRHAMLGTVSSDDTGRTPIIRIALTREEGKNEKLRTAIQQMAALGLTNKMELYELPCIAHAEGADYVRLRETLTNESWDYIAVTSPEAARVLASAWPFQDATTTTTTMRSPPAVAAVGSATEQVLRDANIDVSFCPSKATAETLVVELPLLVTTTPTSTVVTSSTRTGSQQQQQQQRVLYPASAKAASTLADGLAARGFHVTRLNTYDTVTAKWKAADRDVARTCQIVCFASPSAVKGWVSNMNHHDDDNDSSHNTVESKAAGGASSTSVMAACIGETSAKACRKLGWADPNIVAAAQPGLDGWVAAIVEAVESIMTKEKETK